MKTLLTILVLLSGPVLGQNLDTGDLQDVKDIRRMEEEEALQAEDAATDEEPPQEEVMPEGSIDEAANDKIQVECQCPPPVQNEQAEPANSLFPPEAVFFIAPQPAPVAPVKEEAKPRLDLAPGYGGKMPAGYSDDTYKQIQ